MQWDELVAIVSNFVEIPAGEIHDDTLLIDGLGLDSLALTELLITLIEEHQVESLEQELFSRSWEGVTLGQLYDLYCGPSPLAPAAQQPASGAEA